MPELTVDSVVKYIGPSTECQAPDEHQTQPGAIGVVSPIVERDGHDFQVIMVMSGAVGWAMASELQPINEW